MLSSEDWGGCRGRPSWHGVPSQGGASPRFAEKWNFERKRDEHNPPCRISVLISDREIRRILQVHMKLLIGRVDLGVRFRPIRGYTPVGIIYMGFGVKGLRLGHPGRGSGFHFP